MDDSAADQETRDIIIENEKDSLQSDKKLDFNYE